MDMDLGTLLDYCNEWNEAHEIEEQKDEQAPKTRQATQADWDRFFGG